LFARYESDLEKQIDLELLKSSASGILIEFETNRSWRCNPLLYLKIAFIGLDHALTKPAEQSRERLERTASRLYAIPRLLSQGIENLGDIPETYHRAARVMVHDCKDYLTEIKKCFSDRHSETIIKGLQKARSAVEAFDMFLNARSPCPDHHFKVSSMEANLRDHFLCIRSLDEIFEIAADEWHATIRQLRRIQSKLDNGKSWQELYHAFSPSEAEQMDTASLYQDEIERIRLFFSDHGFRKGDLSSPLVFSETPTYLRSVRGTASFGAAFSPDAREKSFFFITTHMPKQSSRKATNLIKRRLHREYKFLTAHETIPGHQRVNRQYRHKLLKALLLLKHRDK